jgi:dTDP-4-amino-4,6-dideoxygalactose transaminase
LFPSVEQRDRALEHLQKNEVGTGVFYPVSIHKQKIIDSEVSLPVSESVSKRVLSLPIHPSLSQSDLDKIVEVFNQC